MIEQDGRGTHKLLMSVLRHWLDVGEFMVAFAYAYDWLYDAWTPEQREAVLWSIVSLGLNKGAEAYNSNAWFLSVRGNWNCESTCSKLRQSTNFG
jgi:hypothetical protein